MKQITTETTLGSLAASFADMVIDKAAENHIKHASLPDNLIKGEVFNLDNGKDITIVFKARINGEEFESRDSIPSNIERSEGNMIFDIGTRKDSRVYISHKCMEELWRVVKHQIVKTITK